jgi:hypothetical protein
MDEKYLIPLALIISAEFFKGFFRKITDFFERRTIRNLFQLALKDLIIQVDDAIIGLENTKKAIVFGDSLSFDFEIKRIVMNLGQDGLSYSNCFPAFFVGLENWTGTFKEARAREDNFNNIFSSLDTILFWNNFFLEERPLFIKGFSNYNNLRGTSIEKVRKLFDDLRVIYGFEGGKPVTLPNTQAIFLAEFDKIFYKWSKMDESKRTRADIIHENLVLPLKRFLKDYVKQYNWAPGIAALEDVMQAEYYFHEQENVLSALRNQIENAITAMRIRRELLSSGKNLT